MNEKTVVCPLCNGHDLKMVTRKVRFGIEADVFRCSGCTLIFLDTGSFAYPKDFYEREYHQTYITHVEPSAFDPAAYYEKMLKSTRIWADKMNALLTGNEMVLDVGCSTGHFLTMIREKAKAVYGHDLNKKEVHFCRETLGLDVSDKPLEERFQNETFDYITLMYVLEHIEDPVGFLNYLKPLLKPSGKFVILVPNANDPLVDFFDLPEFRDFYFCIEHLFYYTPPTLQSVFDKVRLKGTVEDLQEYPLTNHLNWGYRRKPTDTIQSRTLVPDIKMRDDIPMDAWEQFWNRMDMQYKEFLLSSGYGDRIWAIAGLRNEI